MRKRLPPLPALQAFEAAARHLSYTRAADELSLTHGAISRQVHGLEGLLGERLIERLGPRLKLTNAGEELLAKLAEPLHELRRALYAEDDVPGELQLNTLASFAGLWLAPRLSSLLPDLAGYRLRIETHYALARFPPDSARLGVRYGNGKWPGLKAIALMDDEIVLVTTPMGLQRYGMDWSIWPADTWVHHEGTPWHTWQPRESEPNALQLAATTWNDAAAALHAIQQTNGIGLTRLSLAGDGIRQGTLCFASPRRIRAPMRYWLVYRPEFARHEGLQLLIDGLRRLATPWEREWELAVDR